MIKEYQSFASCPNPITEPIIVNTEENDGKCVWLLVPEISCAIDIAGAHGNQHIKFFIFRDSKTDKVDAMACYTISTSRFIEREQFFSAVEEKYPEFFEFLLWHADWF